MFKICHTVADDRWLEYGRYLKACKMFVFFIFLKIFLLVKNNTYFV